MVKTEHAMVLTLGSIGVKCEGSGGETVGSTYATNAGLELIELIGWALALRHPHPPKHLTKTYHWAPGV
jgi:hypothetical protein